MGMPIGLDFGAIMTMGAHLGADMELLAGVLPRIEPIIISNLSGDESEAGDEPVDSGTED
jgi:hypothetical protein